MSLNRIAALGVGLSVLLLTGCTAAPVTKSQPATPTPIVSAEPATPEATDTAVRAVLTAYLEALNAGDYAKAASYWAPSASVTPPSGETLKEPGVSNWHLESTEMIQSTNESAYVQLNFDVKVVAGASSNYADGRNVRYIRLAKVSGAWKITSMAANS